MSNSVRRVWSRFTPFTKASQSKYLGQLRYWWDSQRQCNDIKRAGAQHYKIVCAPSKDSGQPAHPHSLIRVIDPILVILRIEYRLSRGKGGGGGAYAASQTTVLHMKRLNQTDYPIFVILCILCFQRQSFFTFIVWHSLGSQGSKASSVGERRPLSACADDLSLRWVHMESCRKCAPAQNKQCLLISLWL